MKRHVMWMALLLIQLAAPPPGPDVAALVSAAVAEGTRELNRQIIGLHDQINAVANPTSPIRPSIAQFSQGK